MKTVGLVLVAALVAFAGPFAIRGALAEPQVAGAVTTASASEGTALEETGGPVSRRLAGAHVRLPMRFEANRGQADESVKFISRGDGFSLFLTSTQAVLAFSNRADEGSTTQPAEGKAAVALLRMKLRNSNPAPLVAGLDELPGRTNYLIGNDPGQWRTDIPTYGKVAYEEVYGGIDLVYYIRDGELEYDFVVAPGVSPGTIRMQWEGASRVWIDTRGNLVVDMPRGGLRQPRPLIYQVDGAGERQEIQGGYRLLGGHEVGFELAAYDVSKPLYIDPVLTYSTYLGGSAADLGRAMALDGSGNIYVAGITVSSDFPVVTALQPQIASASFGDAFVAKLNADGTALVYATYLGGSVGDIANGIVVDAGGNAFVVGLTASSDFPTLNAFQEEIGGVEDAFIAKLNPTGSALLFSSFLGGNNTDSANTLALDTAGDALVAGHTLSADFPTTAGVVQPACANVFCDDAFVAKVTASGALSLSTFLGGENSDTAASVALDDAGNIYLTGSTNSAHFPVTPGAFQVTCARCDQFYYDVFIVKMNSTASTLVYSTYLGGNLGDFGRGIAVDADGNAYVTGEAESFDFDVTAGVFQPTGGFDAFVTKLDPTGSALVYSTYLGGSVRDEGYGIAVDAGGNAHVTGSTQSGDFPTVSATQATHGGLGSNDAFVSVVNPEGSALLFSTFLGGVGEDSGMRIVLDSAGNSYVVGETFSLDFPTTAGALANTLGGSGDVFIAKFTLENTDPGGNAAPVASDDAFSVNEDQVLNAAPGVLLNDTDADADLLTAVLDTATANGMLTLNADGSFTYAPNADFHGVDSFTYHANDGQADSNVAVGTLTINPVNDAPSFTAGPKQTVIRDASAQSVAGWAANISPGPNEEGQAVSFIVSNDNNALFSAQPAVSSTGTLTYTPAAGQSGTATVTVTLMDDGGTANGGVDTSAPQTFTVMVADFTVAAACQGGNPPCNSPTQATITRGQSVSFSLTGTPVPSAPYANPVTVSCSGLPAGATCSFAPNNTLSLMAGPQTVMLTLHTTAPFSAQLEPVFDQPTGPPVYAFWLGLPGLGLLGLALTGRSPAKRRAGALCLMTLVLTLSSLLAACGGSNDFVPRTPTNGTPTGSHSISVTATGGTLQRTVNLTVVVQ